MQILEQEGATADEASAGGPGTAGRATGRGGWILRSHHLHLGTAALNVVWPEPVVLVEGKGGLILGGDDILQYVVVSPGWRTGFGREAEFGWGMSPGMALGCVANASADVARDQELCVEEAEKAYCELARTARNEVFEDGVLNCLSNGIPDFLLRFGPDGIEAIERLWDGNRLDAETLAETLLWLGRVRSPATLGGRLGLLVKGLREASPRVRDAAGLGLASLGDRRSVPYLRQAREHESIPELRASLEELLQELAS